MAEEMTPNRAIERMAYERVVTRNFRSCVAQIYRFPVMLTSGD